MADRELTTNEETGTFIQNKNTGTKGTIRYKDFGGYHIYCATSNVNKFIPYSKVGEYVVIE